MAETPDEGKQETEEKIEVPTPTFTEGQAQPLGGDLKSLHNRLEALEKNVLGQLKALQGDKDRRIPKLESSLQELMSEVTRLKGHGFTDDEAVAEVEFRQQVKELAQKIKGTEQLSQPTGTGVSEAAQEAQRVIEELKLNTSDPDVMQLLSGNYRNYDHLRAEAALLVARKLSKPAPSSAASPPVTGGTVPQPDLVAEYKKEIAGLRGNITRISDIQAKYRKLGLQV